MPDVAESSSSPLLAAFCELLIDAAYCPELPRVVFAKWHENGTARSNHARTSTPAKNLTVPAG
jgi:hypothetical protein